MQTLDYGPSPESAAPAQAWLDAHRRRFGHWIGGRAVPGRGLFATLNPASGQELARIAQGSAAQVDAAVAAARQALKPWAALGGHGRARYLYAIARALQRHARLFAVLETLDNGKPIRETRDVDVPLAIRHFYHHAGWAQLLDRQYPQHRPLGVVGQIVPWNFPLLMLAWKIAPALACGNTVVFKPAEATSLTAMRFAELCAEIGLPPGVVNIVTGDGAVGQAIVAHDGIAKIAFTGSTDVGRAIRTATAGTGRKLTLELGGKSPYIVCPDADLDSAVEGLVDGIWFNQGQVCCAGSRLLVHEGIESAFVHKLKARMARIRVGDPLDKSTDIGALISAEQLARVSGFVERARGEGAEVFQACAGGLPGGAGCWFAPTLVSQVGSASEIVREEVFGPVLTVQSFRTPAEAAALANDTRYGLAASVWSESIGQALEIAPRLKCGVVWINGANQFDAACGFGGYRESGFGREGGREGLREYLKEPLAAGRGAVSAGRAKAATSNARVAASLRVGDAQAAPVDRTPKLYIGGKQQRPDSGYSRSVQVGRRVLGWVPEGNRKDIRNAVEAARAAAGWSAATAHGRAQVLYYMAENLDAQRMRFIEALRPLPGGAAAAQREVEASVRCLFDAAAWADKHDGAVHAPPVPGITFAVHEPLGGIGLVASDAHPLLGLLALAAPALAMGNRIVAVPSRAMPLIAAELYALLDTSDLPGGALNLVTGDADALADTLAAHADLEAFWWLGCTQPQARRTQALSVSNLKRTWVETTQPDWFDVVFTGGLQPLQQAVQVKNIWVPYGV